ncbi:hypothetical protein FA13DRAFT_1606363, partial [Coprinellus micaceus]
STSKDSPSADSAQPNPLGPFPNLSSFELGEWFVNRGAQFSVQSLQHLVKLAQAPGFARDISEADWPGHRPKRRKASSPQPDQEEGRVDDDGWKTTPISIPVPLSKSTTNCVTGTLYHCSIVSVLREKVLNSDMRLFHYEPSEILWQPDPSVAARRVYSELYNSEAFLRTHQELQDTPAPPGCKLQRVVVGLMFWSDETHVSSFSDEKLWPGYMAFANESKYQRCRPSQSLFHHIAYFSDLPDELKDLVTSKTKKGNVPDKLMHFCKQEMLHAQWKIILNDDKFQDAVKNGIVLKCLDGDSRRFYIRVFTYSADYQEKILIATIRGMNGLCPCHRCLASQADLSKMGTAEDLVLREQMSRKDDNDRLALVQAARGKLLGGLGLSSAPVDGPLKTQSLQPVSNAFSDPKIFASGVDIFGALVVDQMHEFEQGVWKDLFVHLLRVLAASGPGQSLAHVLDRRFRLVPGFGRTIRRFADDVSEQKRKTARDYEDLLQCAIPVFDDILPNKAHCAAIVSILAVCAEWHALAKLRMHTDDTLQLLQDTTVKLGNEFRSFLDGVCQEVATEELDSEKRARDAQSKRKAAAKGSPPARAFEPPPSLAVQQAKTLSLTKPKFHFLGDYVKTIRLFGTTDNYSTEGGELMHRSSKRWYRRSSKRNPRKEVVRHERKVARIRALRRNVNRVLKGDPKVMQEQMIAAQQPDIHHYIGFNESIPIPLLSFAKRPDSSVPQDPLVEGFIPGLQAHLLPRLTKGHNIPNLDATQVCIKSHRIFSHKIMRLKYTTYDVRRGEDVIHLDSDTCDIMVRNPKYPEKQQLAPYLHGRVLGIYHTYAYYSGELGPTPALPVHMEFLWVRWYESANLTEPRGPLECVVFPDVTSFEATTFIDPMSALRASHIIPRFSRGRKYPSGDGLSRMARDWTDWSQYYVNRFADRDMYMRYNIGMAVGH